MVEKLLKVFVIIVSTIVILGCGYGFYLYVSQTDEDIAKWKKEKEEKRIQKMKDEIGYPGFLRQWEEMTEEQKRSLLDWAKERSAEREAKERNAEREGE